MDVSRKIFPPMWGEKVATYLGENVKSCMFEEGQEASRPCHRTPERPMNWRHEWGVH